MRAWFLFAGLTAITTPLVGCVEPGRGAATAMVEGDLRIGARVEVELAGAWVPAKVIDTAPDRWLVHYEQGDHPDEIVGASRIRPGAEPAPALTPALAATPAVVAPPVPTPASSLAAGARVEVERYRTWHPATVVEALGDQWRIRYDAYGQREELVDASRIRALGAHVEGEAPVRLEDRTRPRDRPSAFVSVPVGSFRPLHPVEFGLGATIGPTWFKEQEAAANGLGHFAPSIGLGMTLDFYEIVTTSFTYERVFTSDDKSFKELVTDEFGNVLSATSTTHVNVFLLSAGLRTPPIVVWRGAQGSQAWSGIFAYLRGGTALIASDRSIDNCDDCDTKSLPLHSGPFVEPGIKFYGGERLAIAVGISYRAYLAGSSLAGEVPLSLEFWGR